MLQYLLHSTSTNSLSIGQQQRVAAARALIGQPELVIADEPTSALDADTREAFIRLLFDECRAAGASLLFVSHDQSLAPLFDRHLSPGRPQPRRQAPGGLMYLLRLALASLANRRFTAFLTAFAIALSVCLLLAVERVLASLQVKPTTMMKPGAYVVVLEDFIKTLTPQERAAIVYHEIGHLVNDHLVNVKPENIATEANILGQLVRSL